MQPYAQQQNDEISRNRLRKYGAAVDVPESYQHSVQTSTTLVQSLQGSASKHVVQPLPEVNNHYVPPVRPTRYVTYRPVQPATSYITPVSSTPALPDPVSVQVLKKLVTDNKPPISNYKHSKTETTTDKKTILSSLFKASVTVERVTRLSVKAVRHSFEPPEISALRSRKQKMLVRTFYGLGTLSFVFSLVAGSQTLFSSKQAQKAPQSVLGITNVNNDANRNSEMPTENIPTTQDIRTYLVAPQYPRYIRIPRIDLESRVRRLGLDRNGAVGTPNNINDTGWYDGSVKPGDKEGASIIVGHVAGATLHGVFWDLSKLTIGDSIDVEKGNGEIVIYKVTKTQKVPADKLEMAQYLLPEVAGKHDLKLMTIAGKYDKVSGQYLNRLIVFAEQQ